jgi:hypothetical protein
MIVVVVMVVAVPVAPVSEFSAEGCGRQPSGCRVARRQIGKGAIVEELST